MMLFLFKIKNTQFPFKTNKTYSMLVVYTFTHLKNKGNNFITNCSRYYEFLII